MSNVLKIEEVGRVLTGKTPKTSMSEFWDGDLPFYTPSDMDGRRYLDGVKRCITEAGLKAVKNSAIPPNSVMVSCIGSDMGKVSLSVEHGVTNQQINTVIPNEKIVDYLYLYYSLLPRKAELQMLGSGGSAQPILNKGQFSQLEVIVPSLKDQKAIAHILGTLDDKIELNQKMNQTLEEIAKAIFKSWFVDFDPVRAKAEGRSTGLPPEISDLFPDELVDSEIGKIPKGWSVSSIGDNAKIIDCLHSKKPTLINEGFNFLQLKQIGDDGLLYIEQISKISESDYEKWTSRIEVREGDCIVTNVGRVGAYARIPNGFVGAIGRNITAIRPKIESSIDFFIADYLSSPLYQREKELKTDTGTILDALNVKNIPLLRFTYPSLPLIEYHQRITKSFWQRRELLVRENNCLAELRDTLLPKLISGELRIPDAEKFLEEAGI